MRGEREYTVGPLALKDTGAMSPADLARSPAVRLFVERVREVRPDFVSLPRTPPRWRRFVDVSMGCRSLLSSRPVDHAAAGRRASIDSLLRDIDTALQGRGT